MTRWARGEAEIERMLKSGELQAVTGTAADGGPWLTKAAATIRTAESISPPTRTPPTRWRTTRHGSPASDCWHSKACARPPQAATTRYKLPSSSSSARRSPPTRSCDAAATNCSTQNSQTRQ